MLSAGVEVTGEVRNGDIGEVLRVASAFSEEAFPGSSPLQVLAGYDGTE